MLSASGLQAPQQPRLGVRLEPKPTPAFCAVSAPRSLYVYYRVPAEQRVLAQAAIAAMQATLRQAEPGLTTQLMCRADTTAAGSELTWMEVYTHVEGIGPTFEARLSQAASGLPSCLAGPRHVEVFCPLAPSSSGAA